MRRAARRCAGQRGRRVGRRERCVGQRGDAPGSAPGRPGGAPLGMPKRTPLFRCGAASLRPLDALHAGGETACMASAAPLLPPTLDPEEEPDESLLVIEDDE